MDTVYDIVGEDKARMRDFWELKIHQNGGYEIKTLHEDITDLKNDIRNKIRRILENFKTFVFKSVENTPTTSLEKISIRDESIYIYNKQKEVSMRDLMRIETEVFSRKISDSQKQKKAERILDLIKENEDILDFSNNFSYKNEMNYELTPNTIKIPEGTITLKEFPPSSKYEVKILIENSEDIVEMMNNFKIKILKNKIQIRNLVINIAEIIKIGAHTETPSIYKSDNNE